MTGGLTAHPGCSFDHHAGDARRLVCRARADDAARLPEPLPPRADRRRTLRPRPKQQRGGSHKPSTGLQTPHRLSAAWLKRRSRLALVDAPTVCNRVAEHSADRLTRAALLPCVVPHPRSRTTRGATAASRAGSRCTATWTSRRGSSRRRLRRTPRAPAPPGAPSRATARRRRRTRASSPSSTGCASTSASSRCATSVRPTRRGSSPDTSSLAEQAAAATPRTHAPPRLLRPRLTRSCPTSHAARSRVCAVRRVARGGGGAPARPPPGRATWHARSRRRSGPVPLCPPGSPLSSQTKAARCPRWALPSDEGRTHAPWVCTRPGCARALVVHAPWLCTRPHAPW